MEIEARLLMGARRRSCYSPTICSIKSLARDGTDTAIDEISVNNGATLTGARNKFVPSESAKDCNAFALVQRYRSKQLNEHAARNPPPGNKPKQPDENLAVVVGPIVHGLLTFLSSLSSRLIARNLSSYGHSISMADTLIGKRIFSRVVFSEF